MHDRGPEPGMHGPRPVPTAAGRAHRSRPRTPQPAAHTASGRAHPSRPVHKSGRVHGRSPLCTRGV